MDERRGNQRIPSKFEINYVNEGDYLISYSKDLSVDGMFVSTNSPPAVGEETWMPGSTIPKGAEYPPSQVFAASETRT